MVFTEGTQAFSWSHQRMETFSALLAICAGIRRSLVNSPYKGQWALMFPLICAWINRWVNNGEAGDFRRYRAHYDVIVMPAKHNIQWYRAVEPNSTMSEIYVIVWLTVPKEGRSIEWISLCLLALDLTCVAWEYTFSKISRIKRQVW